MLHYSHPAIADLRQLRTYIAQHNPSAAKQVAETLLKRIELLKEFPNLGHPVSAAPDPDSVRDCVFGRYVVRYAKREGGIVILRIWHHAQDR